MDPANRPPFNVSQGCLEIRFLGRDAPGDRMAALSTDPAAPPDLAALHQVHSARVVEASPGPCGEADGLWTQRRGLALGVVTADCVPLVIADQNRLAVVHAGWRGIAAGIVASAVRALGETQGLSAWLGPAIGPCCYEVSADVANQLIQSSNPSIVTRGSGGRPHVDLRAAIAVQLRGHGVREVHTVFACTRCLADDLWSYRGCGPGAGRNFTFAWLDDRVAKSESDRYPGRGVS